MTIPFAPQWMTPDQAGELCNFHGSNTGGDAIALKARYLNSAGPTDPAGLIRVVANRTVLKGAVENPELAWDSGWVGNPSTNPIPFSRAIVGSAMYNGRVYVLSSGKDGEGGLIASAPITGANVGSWRNETPVPVTSWLAGTTPLILNGRLYVMNNISNVGPGIYIANINADGTLTWQNATNVASNAGPNAASPVSGWISGTDGSSYAWITVLGINPGNTSSFASVNLNTGAIGAWTTTATMPALQQNSCVYYDTTGGKVYVIGGDNNTTPATATEVATVTATTGALGAFAAGAALPAARTFGSLAVAQGFVYFMGGQSTAGSANFATNQSTVYYISLANLSNAASAWTTSAQALPAARAQAAGFATAVNQTPSNAEWIVIAGGYSAGVLTNLVQEASIPHGGGVESAFVSGQGATLTSGLLGVGGSVATNPAFAPQGTIDYGFSYAAFGAAAVIASFNDADQVQFTVYFADLFGDISPGTATTIKIGQPPAITSGTGAASNGSTQTTGFPPYTFTIQPGVGGQPEKTWQLQVKDGTTVVYDSGVKYDQSNAGTVSAAPSLVTGKTYTVVITVISGDAPMTGSASRTVSTTTFTTALVAQAPPTGLTVVPDPVNGLVTLTWTNGATSSYTRVYMRPTGSTTWTLVKDNVAGTSVQLMDQIPLGSAEDYAVANVSAAGAESTMSAAVTNVIISPDFHWDAGGYHAMLHIAGNGPAQHVTLYLIDQPHITTLRDTYWEMMFGQTAPSARFGTSQFRQIELHVSQLLTSQTLDTILALANAGSVLCYRDTTGLVIYCTLDHSNGSHARKLHLYADVDVYLVEIAFTYTP